jgi:transcription antitermination factor NusG
VPDEVINDLKEQVGEDEQKDLPEPEIKPGQEVSLIEGPFKDLKAVVNSWMDARQRVAILLEFLGRQMEIQVPAKDLIVEIENPKEGL